MDNSSRCVLRFLKNRKENEMKTSLIVVLCLALYACALDQPPPPQCTMSWSCGNSQCAADQGQWSGNGTFSGSNDESDCLAWETLFLNGPGYPHNSVSACTCN